MIYVTSFNCDRVAVFASDARGNALPARKLAGARTRLRGPIGIGIDAARQLYVANRRGGNVTVYPPDAQGDVAPVRTLTAVGLRAPEAIAITPRGDAFVSTWPNDERRSAAIYHFPPTASQSDYAIAGARTALTFPVGLALDEGCTLYVANAFGGVVSAFASDAVGDCPPLWTFTAGTCSTRAIACGARMLLVSGANVFFYPCRAGRAARPAAVIGRSALLPRLFAGGIAIDASITPPLVCVADYAAATVYTIRTRGVAPNLEAAAATAITGSATGLDGPTGVLVAD